MFTHQVRSIPLAHSESFASTNSAAQSEWDSILSHASTETGITIPPELERLSAPDKLRILAIGTCPSRLRISPADKGPGGSVRVGAALILIHAICVHATAAHNARAATPREGLIQPWELWDVIGGTSAGGLLAILLGRLRIPIENLVVEFPALCRDLFELPAARRATRVCSMGTSCVGRRCSASTQRKVFLGYMALYGFGPDTRMALDAPGPDFFVVARDTSHMERPVLLSNRGATGDMRVIDCAQATTAAPTYYPAVQIGDEHYADGGVGSNNPAALAVQFAGVKQDGENLAALVSVGTGGGARRTRWDHRSSGVIGVLRLSMSLARMSTETQSVHQQLLARFEGDSRYQNFDFGDGLGDVGFTDWKRVPELMATARRHTGKPVIISQIQDCLYHLRA